MNPFVVAYLMHLGRLAGLSAAVTVVAALVVLLTGINPATLPIQYQILATAFVPLVLGALTAAQKELAAELAAEEAAKADARANAAEAKVAVLQAKLGPNA